MHVVVWNQSNATKRGKAYGLNHSVTRKPEFSGTGCKLKIELVNRFPNSSGDGSRLAFANSGRRSLAQIWTNRPCQSVSPRCWLSRGSEAAIALPLQNSRAISLSDMPGNPHMDVEGAIVPGGMQTTSHCRRRQNAPTSWQSSG